MEKKESFYVVPTIEDILYQNTNCDDNIIKELDEQWNPLRPGRLKMTY